MVFISAFEQAFTNGCRAHPRRQMHGDICYLLVRPHDTDKMYITASTGGYYINKVRAQLRIYLFYFTIEKVQNTFCNANTFAQTLNYQPPSPPSKNKRKKEKERQQKIERKKERKKEEEEKNRIVPRD